MAYNAKLTNVIAKIQDMGYDYMYIDDNGIRGTLDPSIFKNTTYYYFINEFGHKVYLSADPKEAEEMLLEEEQDISSLQHDELKRGIYNNDIFFDPNQGKICLYLINQKEEEYDNVIGYIEGTKPDDSEEPDFDVYINKVTIYNNEKYRGKGLCKLMTQLFLLSVNVSNQKFLSFELYNVGGDIACKCYFNAFTDCGYETKVYIPGIYPIKKIDAKGICKIMVKRYEKFNMAFTYIGSRGGKTRKNKKYLNTTRQRIKKTKNTKNTKKANIK